MKAAPSQFLSCEPAMPQTPTHPTSPGDDSPTEGDAAKKTPDDRARDRRLVVIVEAFLRQVRNGGSLDPEPFLEASSDLRAELTPLLYGVLRLEQISSSLDSLRKTTRERQENSEREGSG
jgi:hypothetical protein